MSSAERLAALTDDIHDNLALGEVDRESADLAPSYCLERAAVGIRATNYPHSEEICDAQCVATGSRGGCLAGIHLGVFQLIALASASQLASIMHWSR